MKNEKEVPEYSNLVDRLFKAILPDPLERNKTMRDAIIALQML